MRCSCVHSNVLVTGGGRRSSGESAAGIPAPESTQVDVEQGGGKVANARIVAEVARSMGVDPVLAVAAMLKESGGRADAVGDNGTSFGLFQLHRGGRLTTALRNGWITSEQEAFDPRTNASVALRAFARVARNEPGLSPGQVAAAAQRPADPEGYAMRVERLLPRAQELLRAAGVPA